MVEVKSMSTKVSTPISVLRIPQKLERAPFAGSKEALYIIHGTCAEKIRA